MKENITNMTDIATLADHASAQSDRWLFIATLIILLVSFIAIWRWLVSDRQKLADRLTDITDKYLKSSQELSSVVANNTVALQEVKDFMREYKREK